jgi:2-(1,2-epoxy-1,2-dihydrophenyl)acetyl-CoA isomerase
MGPLSSQFPDLTVAVDEAGVAELTICRPPDNYFDPALLNGIADALELLATSGDARVVVLASEGRHFCAGARLTGGGLAPAEIYAPARRIFGASLPIVAVVHGAAVGGGLGLALAADFRIGTHASRFSANFARLGFHHGFGLSVTLPAVVGRQRALELLLTGRRINGDEALRIGLVDRLVESEDLTTSAQALALEIARSAPLAVTAIRTTMRATLVEDFGRALDREAEQQERLFQTEDHQEGVTAMRERRLPDFHGR